MGRRDRQRAELLALCETGSVGRAIDLALCHLAEFGPDDDLLHCMEGALGQRNVTPAVMKRFIQLRHTAG